ncbi:Lipase 5 [Tieghemiomyces parasiticus]|uniref:Patatin-like phospholipase domain-containing protein n=1 Tax=Tieghemiomyces parasiticus TaxID=78921 RepID=A0A9W7ZRE5_9FUNG|nr:Lipase 5 [Tieghemiomyces parasiticus]
MFALLWSAFLLAIRPLTLTVEVLVRTWQHHRLHDPKRRAHHSMKLAKTYADWASAAQQLDVLEGNEAWKARTVSDDYGYRLLQSHIEQLRTARYADDVQQCMFLVRTLVSRNVGHMGKPKVGATYQSGYIGCRCRYYGPFTFKPTYSLPSLPPSPSSISYATNAQLYAYTHIGTKHLIEEYLDEVVQSLEFILGSVQVPLAVKYGYFSQVRQAFGRTAVLLSGGATFGLCHAGVLKCLHETHLLPRVISGSSAGSIMAAMLCTCTDDQVEDLLQLRSLNLELIDPAEVGRPWDCLGRLLKHGALYSNRALIRSLRDNIGELTFLEAYNRTRRILNITVTTSTTYETQHLLNYLTAPNVVIWSAAAASCAAPLIFAPGPILAKDKAGDYVPWGPADTEWIDGSVQNDLPMQRLAELFNVNHFVVSQVNPYVMPFLALSNTAAATFTSRWRRLLRTLVRLTSQEVLYRLRQLRQLAVLPRILFRVEAMLAQKYSGDVTIMPKISLADYASVLVNPTIASLRRYQQLGERATWPCVTVLRNHCQVELLLDRIIYRLRSERIARDADTRLRRSRVSPRRALPLSPLVSTEPVPHVRPIGTTVRATPPTTDTATTASFSGSQRDAHSALCRTLQGGSTGPDANVSPGLSGVLEVEGRTATDTDDGKSDPLNDAGVVKGDDQSGWSDYFTPSSTPASTKPKGTGNGPADPLAMSYPSTAAAAAAPWRGYQRRMYTSPRTSRSDASAIAEFATSATTHPPAFTLTPVGGNGDVDGNSNGQLLPPLYPEGFGYAIRPCDASPVAEEPRGSAFYRDSRQAQSTPSFR